MRLRYTIIYDLSGSTVFFHIISLTARLSKKNIVKYNMCDLISSKILS
jgi:hypothetical protein